MDDTLPAAGDGYGEAGPAVARALAALTAAPAPSVGTVVPLVAALTVALDQDATEGPYAAAETELTRRLPEQAELRALMLAGAGTARALRWSGRSDQTLWPRVRELFDRAEAGLPTPAPTQSWLGACLPLFSAQLCLTVRAGDAETARAAGRLAGLLGGLLDRHPELADTMARTVAAGAGRIGVPAGGGVAIREALRMLEQLLPMMAALSSFSLPGIPFGAGAVPGWPDEPGPMFVPSRRAQPEALPPADH